MTSGESTNVRGESTRTCVVAGFIYAIFWVATRWPAIAANTLFFDDFAVPLRPAVFYVGPYRPLLWLEYTFFEALHRGHFFTIVPKISAAVYLGAAATAFALLLRRWGVDRAPAFMIPLVALANPVLNEAGLWQTVHALPLAFFLIIAGVLAWETPTRICLAIGFLLILAGLLGYQIFAAFGAVLLVAEAIVKRLTAVEWHWRQSATKAALLAGTAGVQIVVMQIIRHSFAGADARGFPRIESAHQFLIDKMHGVFDLAVNGIMPVMAFYAGAARAASLWKWPLIALAIAGAMSLKRMRAIAFVFPFVMFLLPAIPVLGIDHSPYAWRVSSPEAFSLALALLLPLVAAPRAAALAALAVAAAMVPAAHYEAAMRRSSWLRDRALIEKTDRTVVYDGTRGAENEDIRMIGPHDLTWGYQRRTPGMWSALNNPWVARNFIENYEHRRFIDCSEDRHPVCIDAVAACARNAGQPWPRVFLVRDTAVVCGRPARNGNDTLQLRP